MSNLSLNSINEYACEKKDWKLTNSIKHKIDQSFEFLSEFSSDKIIYGINTGFGPMAQFKIENDKLNQLQYNLIRSHCSGIGDVLDDECVRAVIVARINNFLQGNSGISYDVINQLVAFLNNDIYPEIYEHGGVGASGDLVQLAHLALNLIGEGYVKYNNERRPAIEVMNQLNIQPLKLKLRDGLGLLNGTSCMTGIAAINLIYAQRLLTWSICSSSIINEIVESYDDSFSIGLNATKKHFGQQYIAEQMRDFLSSSKLIRNRNELFKDNSALNNKEFSKKIQEYYSIRCVPQILGPIKETIDNAIQVIENEINSTNDNPIISIDENNVFHGGNFHGDYVSLEMDKIKLVITKMTMLAERQLNFILNNKLNNQFPAFLNKGILGFNFGLQGIQFTATSTTAENQTLSTSSYIHSISNNNDNQDIVSMGTNSALLAKKIIDNCYQVMAIHMISICQAIDLLEVDKFKLLSKKTKEVYTLIREITPETLDDVPLSEKIKKIIVLLRKTSI